MFADISILFCHDINSKYRYSSDSSDSLTVVTAVTVVTVVTVVSREHRCVGRRLCLGKRDPDSESAEVRGPGRTREGAAAPSLVRPDLGQNREGAQAPSLVLTNCLIKAMP